MGFVLSLVLVLCSLVVAPVSAVSGSVVLDFDSLPTGTFVEHQEDGFRIHHIGFGDLQTISDVAGNHVLKDSAYNVYGAEVYINSLNGDNFYFNSLDYNNFNNNSGRFTIHVWAFPSPFDWGTATHVTLNPTSSTFSTLTSAALGVDGVELCQLRVNLVSLTADFSVDNINLTPITTVDTDIKPGSFPNSINVNSKGVIPVAILTTESFDAATVDPPTVEFGPNGAAPLRWAVEDVDSDGDLDLILHFKTQETGIIAGDTEATLTGALMDSSPFTGTDSVRTVPKNS